MVGAKLSLGTTEDGMHGVLLETDDEDLSRRVFDLIDDHLQQFGITVYDSQSNN